MPAYAAGANPRLRYGRPALNGDALSARNYDPTPLNGSGPTRWHEPWKVLPVTPVAGDAGNSRPSCPFAAGKTLRVRSPELIEQEVGKTGREQGFESRDSRSGRQLRARGRRGRGLELGPFWDHDQAVVGDEEAPSIGLEVVANLHVRRDLDVLVDDGAPDAGVPADAHALEEDAVLQLAEAVDAAPDRQHAAMDATAGDDAAVRDERVGRDTDAGLRLVT